jgi:hypothetical protein
MRAWGERLEERLLDILECVRGTVEYGVHREAAVTLAAAQVCSSHELRFLTGYPGGKGVADHERLVEDFVEATSAVTAEVPAEEVILEAL